MNLPDPPRLHVFVLAPAMVCWGLEQILRGAHPHIEVAGTAGTVQEALAQLPRCRSDVLVLDLDACDAASLRQLQQACGSRMVGVTACIDHTLLDRAVLAGVRGIVRSCEQPAVLLKALTAVAGGQLWIERDAAGRVFVEAGRHALPTSDHLQRIATLTARERETIAAVARDAAAPGKVIASRLRISEHTLRNHLSAIYGKLGLANRLDLYAYATRHQLDA